MQCSLSEAVALASQSCSICYGLGIRSLGTRPICRCVWRRIFRICYERFRECTAAEQDALGAEFVADFCRVSRLALTPHEHRLFRFHFLLAAECAACCGKLGLNRGEFFHSVYRIEEKIGSALIVNGLFPLDDYFPRRPNGYLAA